MNTANYTLPRIGVLGGMGPLACADFVVKLVQATPARGDNEHFPITLDSTPQIPSRPEALFNGGPDPMPAIEQVIRRLESAGCELIAVPCNTVHHWYEAMAALSSVPVLHIADAVARRLHELAPEARRVGVLGTRVTSRLGIYPKRLGDRWRWVHADESSLDSFIMPGVATVKAGELALGKELFLAAVQALITREVDAIVLACTEMPVILSQADVSVPVIDSSEALARHAVAIAQSMRGR